MALRGQPVETTTTTLTSSTVSMSETTWTYALAAVLNSIYFDPVTRRIYKALVAGVTLSSIGFENVSNTVQKTAHGASNGDQFAFTMAGGGAVAPSGLSLSTLYYIVNAAADTFQLSLTPDGQPVDFTTNGAATFTGYVNAPFDDASAWQDRGPPNKWAMFDQSNQTATTFSGSCTVVIAPSSRIDSIAALAMSNVSHLYIGVTGTGGPSHTNYFLRSQEFDNAAWVKQAGCTVTANTAAGADLTTTADTLNFGADPVSAVRQTISGTGTWTISVWAKGAGQKFRFLAYNATDGLVSSGDITLTSTLTRYSHTFTVSDNSLFYIANASDGVARPVQAWGAHLEPGTVLTSYIPTTTTSVTTTNHTYYEEFNLSDDSFADDVHASIYSEPIYLRDFAVSDILPLASQSITVRAVSPGTGSIGNLVTALSKDIGKAWYSSRVSTRNFTEGMDPDEFGNVNPVIRGFAKRGNFTVGHSESKSDAIKALYEENRGTPGLWLMAPAPVGSGLQWRQRGIFFGLARNWDFEFWQPNDNKHELEIEGYA